MVLVGEALTGIVAHGLRVAGEQPVLVLEGRQPFPVPGVAARLRRQLPTIISSAIRSHSPISAQMSVHTGSQSPTYAVRSAPRPAGRRPQSVLWKTVCVMLYAFVQSTSHGSGNEPSQVSRVSASQSKGIGPRSSPATRAALATARRRFGRTSAARADRSEVVCATSRSSARWR